MSDTSRYYGKFRATVVNNVDPDNRGRIKVKVASIVGEQDTGWALPCVPYGGTGLGFFFIPPVGANVWVEFENGNPDNLIWTGCFWNPNEVPGDGKPETKIIKTENVTITISDKQGQGGITMETVDGMKIVMDTSGIEISNNGSINIKLTQTSVSVNDGALEVV